MTYMSAFFREKKAEQNTILGVFFKIHVHRKNYWKNIDQNLNMISGQWVSSH